MGGVVRMRRRVEGRIVLICLLKALTSSNEEGEYIQVRIWSGCVQDIYRVNGIKKVGLRLVLG